MLHASTRNINLTCQENEKRRRRRAKQIKSKKKKYKNLNSTRYGTHYYLLRVPTLRVLSIRSFLIVRYRLTSRPLSRDRREADTTLVSPRPRSNRTDGGCCRRIALDELRRLKRLNQTADDPLRRVLRRGDSDALTTSPGPICKTILGETRTPKSGGRLVRKTTAAGDDKISGRGE